MMTHPYKYTLMLSRDGQSIERASETWEHFSELRHAEYELPPLNIDSYDNIPTTFTTILPAQRMTRRELRLADGAMIAVYMPAYVEATDEHARMVKQWVIDAES